MMIFLAWLVANGAVFVGGGYLNVANPDEFTEKEWSRWQLLSIFFGPGVLIFLAADFIADLWKTAELPDIELHIPRRQKLTGPGHPEAGALSEPERRAP